MAGIKLGDCSTTDVEKKLTLGMCETSGESVDIDEVPEECQCQEEPCEAIIKVNIEQGKCQRQGITRVIHDSTLEGDGITNSPLKLADRIKNQIDENTQGLATEIINRATGDDTLSERLTAETNARVNADNTLQSNINAEATARQTADNTLQANINAEASTRQVADTVLGNRLTNHLNDYNNPHRVTKAQVGLGNVDNVSDLDKPISTATQSALDDYGTLLTNEITTRQNADISLDNRVSAIENDYLIADDLTPINTRIDNIEVLIPIEASETNQLADKDYVNDAIQTSTAAFDGNWQTYASVPDTVNGFVALGLPVPGINNYLVIVEDENHDNETWRYKYVGEEGTLYDKANWKPEYKINETAFTDEQWKAINSGITASKVTEYTAHINNSNIHVSTTDRNTWNSKQPALTNENAGEGIAITGSGSNVLITSTRTSVEWGHVTGDMSAQTDLKNALDSKSGVILREW